jgi:hypothetical protein
MKRFALPRETSNSAHEHQDQQNYDYEAQAATAVIAGAIEWRAADTTKAAEENKNQNNQNDCTNWHEFVPSILRGVPYLTISRADRRATKLEE